MAEPLGPIYDAMRSVPERPLSAEAELDGALKGAREPFVIRGLARHWPLVLAAEQGAGAARDYLLRFARARPFAFSAAGPEARGRLHYGDDLAVNFHTASAPLEQIFAAMERAEKAAPGGTLYLGSIDIAAHFDGLDTENNLMLGDRDPLASIWIGTAAQIAAHNDFPDNLAVCAAGRRRFTLFPPEQFANLYLGPLDNTPAGRAVTMVDFDAPNWARFPRFAEAVRAGWTVELNAGDAIFIPSSWWHQVEGLAPFNILINYWWRDTPAWLGQPQDALNHAILAIRDLPEHEKNIWKQMFDHYVFDESGKAAEHLPEEKGGILDRLTAETAGRLRGFLLRALSR